MTAAPSAAPRALRAVTFAVVLVTTTAAAHAHVGAGAPSWPALAAAAVVLAGVGWGVGAARGRILAVTVLASQAALHVAFCLSAARFSMAGVLCGAAHPAAAQPGLVALHVALAPAPHSTTAAVALTVGAHSLAALAALIGLRATEALGTVVAGLVRALSAPLLPPTLPACTAARRCAVVCGTRRLSSLPVLAAAPRRGPPVVGCVSRRHPPATGPTHASENHARHCPVSRVISLPSRGAAAGAI